MPQDGPAVAGDYGIASLKPTLWAALRFRPALTAQWRAEYFILLGVRFAVQHLANHTPPVRLSSFKLYLRRLAVELDDFTAGTMAEARLINRVYFCGISVRLWVVSAEADQAGRAATYRAFAGDAEESALSSPRVDAFDQQTVGVAGTRQRLSTGSGDHCRKRPFAVRSTLLH